MVKRNKTHENGQVEVKKKVLEVLKTKELTVGEIVKIAGEKYGLKDYDVAKAIYELKREKYIRVLDPKPPKNFLGFLFSTRSTWFWLLTFAIAVTNLLVHLAPREVPYLCLRYVFGALFVLYFPGATLTELLFPGEELESQLEKVALSIGLSLAVVPLIALILNYATPWGIRLTPVLTSLTLFTFITGLGAVARKYKRHLKECKASV